MAGRGWVVGQIGWGPTAVGVRRDNFNRADSLTTINPASDGGTWTIYKEIWGINNNTGCRIAIGGTAIEPWLSFPDGPGAYRSTGVIGTGDTGSAAQTVQVDLKNRTGSPSHQIFLNFDPVACAGYWLDTAGGGTATFFRADDETSGSLVTLGTVPLTTWFGTGNVFGNGITTVKIVHDGAGHFDFYQDVGPGMSLVASITDPNPPLTGTEVLLACNVSPNDDNHANFDNFNVITVRVATAQHPFGFSSIDIGIPSGDVGDLLILIHTGFNDTSDPTGWTVIPDVIASGTSLNCRLSVWTRVADGTEGSSVTLTDSGDNDVGACLRYSGVGSYTDTTWSSTNVADSITTPTASANAGDIVLSVWAWEEINTSAALTVTTDAAVTARVPKVQWDQACLAVGEEIAAATGTTTGRTASATNSSSGASRCAMTIVLSP